MSRGKSKPRPIKTFSSTSEPSSSLLSRSDWREVVFDRDQKRCVICGKEAIDAHHIIERKLWPDEGYYLDNGVSLCAECHLRAEKTEVSCNRLRVAAKIQKTHLPPQFSPEDKIDKWGNYLSSYGVKYPGELFYEEQVQKVLAPILDTFVLKFKHPRTPHLPWSLGASADDIELVDLSSFKDREVVVSEKLDGESTTIGRTKEGYYSHARSLDSGYHPTRAYVRKLTGRIGWELPLGWRVSGENLYAEHAIHYNSLLDYFLVYGIANEQNIYLSWDEMQEWCGLLNLQSVPLLWRGVWDEEAIKACFSGKSLCGGEQEGYVVRLSERIPYRMWGQDVAKFVRKGHVAGNEHWTKGIITPNELRSS